MEGPVVIFILVAIAIVIGAIFSAIAAQKRREEIAILAAKLGLSYTSQHNYSLPDEFGFLDKLDQGSNRYAYNILEGTIRGHREKAFDYHYETHSRDSKGRRRTHHHHFSFFILIVPQCFPELTLTQEGVFSKIAQAFGYDDIDFECAEFSRRFCVRSADKKFAYDVCNSRMIEYLLQNDDLNIEIERHALTLGFSRCLAATEIEYNLDRLEKVRSFLPDYLFTNV